MRLSEKERDRRFALYNQNLSDKQIAKILEISLDAFKGWRLRQNLLANYGRIYLNPVEDRERQRLYDIGLSDNEIAKNRGLTRHAVHEWRGVRGLLPNKRYIEPTPLLKFNESLVYVLAVLYSDGWFTKKWSGFGLRVNEKKFAECFHKQLKKVKLHSSLYLDKKTKMWCVFGSSKIFHKKFSSRNFSFLLEKIKQNEKLQWSFLKGAFESEGCVSLRSKGKSIRIELFCNQDPCFFSLISNICNSLNLRYGVYKEKRKNGTLQRLVLKGDTPSLILFLEKFNPIIKNAKYAKELLRTRIGPNQIALKNL